MVGSFQSASFVSEPLGAITNVVIVLPVVPRLNSPQIAAPATRNKMPITRIRVGETKSISLRTVALAMD
jgi:hypothetical protein